jgi:hypothetical protein
MAVVVMLVAAMMPALMLLHGNGKTKKWQGIREYDSLKNQQISARKFHQKTGKNSFCPKDSPWGTYGARFSCPGDAPGCL